MYKKSEFSDVQRLSWMCGELVGNFIIHRYLPTPKHDYEGTYPYPQLVEYSEEDLREETEADAEYDRQVEIAAKNMGYENQLSLSGMSTDFYKITKLPEVKSAWDKRIEIMYRNIRKYFPHTVDCNIIVPMAKGVDMEVFKRAIDVELWDSDISCYSVDDVIVNKYNRLFTVRIKLDKQFLE
jgi:hypothetical protein